MTRRSRTRGGERPQWRQALALAGLVAAGTLLACRGILGIDDDVALLPAASDGGASLEDGPTSAPDGSPIADAASDFDAAFDAGVTAVDRRFAVWPLPPVKPLLSSYVLTADTVTDKTTGLEWERNDASPGTRAYAGGATHCAGLAIGGQTDWRLPTRIEALTFLDYGQTLGLLNQAVFPDGALPGSPVFMWTDSISLLAPKLDDRFQINLELGLVTIAANTSISNRIKCVRGGPTTSPVTRYEVVAGAARDVRTGVVWQVVPVATTKLLADAALACASLVLGGVGGFRLPTVRELASLVDESREVAPLLPTALQPGPSARFWSSTARAKSPAATYGVDFDTANVQAEESASAALSVRCAR